MHKLQKFLISLGLRGVFPPPTEEDGDDPHSSPAPRWKCEGTPSVDGPNAGNSGGTAIATKIHVGMTTPRILGGDSVNDNPYEVVPGHMSAAVINGWVRDRFLAVSVYMDVSDKFKIKNRAILLALGMLIAANWLPYVFMGDWNNTPQELADTGWLETIDGHIVSPSDPTCWISMAKAGRVIDYAVRCESKLCLPKI